MSVITDRSPLPLRRDDAVIEAHLLAVVRHPAGGFYGTYIISKFINYVQRERAKEQNDQEGKTSS